MEPTVRFKNIDASFQKTVWPASIPHKICDHFVHKYFQIGRLLSDRIKTDMRESWEGLEQYSENHSPKAPGKFEIFQKYHACIFLKWTVVVCTTSRSSEHQEGAIQQSMLGKSTKKTIFLFFCCLRTFLFLLFEDISFLSPFPCWCSFAPTLQGKKMKRSHTGNRTRAAAVRAPNPNH